MSERQAYLDAAAQAEAAADNWDGLAQGRTHTARHRLEAEIAQRNRDLAILLRRYAALVPPPKKQP